MNAQAERAPALVIAADATLGERCAALLTELGFAPRSVTTPSTALEQFHDARPHFVVLELDRPDAWGDHLLRQIGERHQATPVLVLAPAPDLRLACAAGRAGAHEILDRAAPADEIRAAVRRLMPETTDSVYPVDRDRAAFFAMYEQIFRGSEKMRQIEQLVLRVAETRHGLLIQGERGVGKELVGRAVHHLATPATAPWVAMNCAALPAEILEVELFGRDPATGDEGARPGRLEQGQGGTLLLKEIAEVPPSLQVKLLRLLDDGEFYRVNGRELHRADLRIIVTTQQPLPSLVAAGSFRADLYQRLQAMSLTVPPLRERREELEPLQKHFRQRFARDFGRPSPPLSRATLDLLVAYAWPGNVQELEDLMKRYVVLGDEQQLRSEIQTRMRAMRLPVASLAIVPALSSLLEGASTGDLRAIARQAAQQAERAAITRVLQEVQWNRAEAARRLRISYKTLLTKLAQADFGKKLRTREGR